MTSKRSLRTFGVRIAKAAFSFSLFLGAVSWGQESEARQPAARDPVAVAKDIKRSPVYRDTGLKDDSNWLSGAANRLKNVDLTPDCSSPRVATSAPSTIGTVLTVVMWSLLAAAVVAFVYFAVRHFAWARKLQRRATAMLDEDEPDRTVDEWLLLADNLEREGRFREAVRALYLACLLKIDEARIARFERGQTNLEHLARILASPTRPQALDFVAPTKAFDEIWYGMRVRGSEDVTKFRAWYSHVTEQTRAKAA